MLKKVTHFTQTKTGMKNRQNALTCEDVCCVIEDENVSVFVLCDGEGRSMLGRDASKVVAEYFAKLLYENFAEFYVQVQGHLTTVLCQEIEKELRKKAEEEKALANEYVTNLMAFAINKKSGECLVFMLGEGTIICKREEDDYFTYFYYGRREEEYLEYRVCAATMEYDWEKKMRSYKWDLKDQPMEQVILLTKGYRLDEESDKYQLEKMSLEYLQQFEPRQEDAGFIWVNI